MITTILLTLLLSSCGTEWKGQSSSVSGASVDSDSGFAYTYCGTVSKTIEGLTVTTNQNVRYGLYSMNENALKLLNNLADNTQACVYGNKPPGDALEMHTGERFSFGVEFLAVGATGSCTCPADYSPVCDTVTQKSYSNSCKAACSGIYSFTVGPCYN